MLVAVGRASVWGVAKGGSVWLRQGVRTDGNTEQLARGTRYRRPKLSQYVN